MKIICIGNATWDRFYTMQDIPTDATKYFAASCLEMGGGIAATAAVTLAKLGANTFLIARTGNDSVGNAIKNDLQSWGVDCTLIKQHEAHFSSNAVVHVSPRGERQITVYRDPRLPTQANWIDEDMLQGIDGVMCDCTWGEGTLRLLRLAKAKGIPSVVDVDLGGERIEEILSVGSHIAFSWPALSALTGESNIELALRQVKQKTSGTVYVTRGEEGCWWLEAGVLRHVAAYPVNVVDTTGAGDVFHGALIFAIAKGLTQLDAVHFACAAAALKCTQPGGRPGIPSYQQTLDFIHLQQKD